tara:strand:+ start:255 stop:482 length:228 start_codon:yes stop_codon:yes gene_type:complete
MINKYRWLALAFFICFIFFWIFMYFDKDNNKQCMTDFDKVDFKNLTDADKFALTVEIWNCIEDPEKGLQLLKKID